MAGGVITVRNASELMTVPAELLTITEYSPCRVGWTAVSVKLLRVAPLTPPPLTIFAPLNRH